MKFAERKSRLSILLGRQRREEFARLLLAEVMDTLAAAGFLRSAYVVSPDDSMLALASEKGSRTVKEPVDAGVNSAVSRGLERIPGTSSVLVLPADLPLLEASDLKLLVAMMEQGIEVVISPSRTFDGTNALLLAKPALFPLSYDHDSFWNHLSGAARDGLSLGVCTRPGLMFDVDTPADFRALALSTSKRRSARYARSVLE